MEHLGQQRPSFVVERTADRFTVHAADQGLCNGLRVFDERAQAFRVNISKPASYANAPQFLARIAADGFVLRCIRDDATIEDLTETEALAGGPNGDWMLCLQRRR